MRSVCLRVPRERAQKRRNLGLGSSKVTALRLCLSGGRAPFRCPRAANRAGDRDSHDQRCDGEADLGGLSNANQDERDCTAADMATTGQYLQTKSFVIMYDSSFWVVQSTDMIRAQANY